MSCPHDFNGTCRDCEERERAAELAKLHCLIGEARAERDRAIKERDRLRAVLDAGERNVNSVTDGLPADVRPARLVVWAVIASLRARAGLD